MIVNITMHAITESFATAYGKNGFPCAFSSAVLAEVGLLLRAVHTRSSCSCSGSSAFSHGGAVVPSLVTR